MARYVDFCIFPIAKKNLVAYKKNTTSVGKLLLKYGALSSKDYVADDENAVKLIFPKVFKLKPTERLIIAIAEFKSKAHREKVFNLMFKDPAMEILMSKKLVDEQKIIMGGFKSLVELEK